MDLGDPITPNTSDGTVVVADPAGFSSKDIPITQDGSSRTIPDRPFGKVVLSTRHQQPSKIMGAHSPSLRVFGSNLESVLPREMDQQEAPDKLREDKRFSYEGNSSPRFREDYLSSSMIVQFGNYDPFPHTKEIHDETSDDWSDEGGFPMDGEMANEFFKQVREQFNDRFHIEIDSKEGVRTLFKSEIGRGIREQTRKDVEGEIRVQVRSEMEDEIRVQVRSEVEDEIRVRVRSEVKDEIRVQVRSEVEDEIRVQVRSELEDEIRVQVRSELENEMNQQTKCQSEEETKAHGGGEDHKRSDSEEDTMYGDEPFKYWKLMENSLLYPNIYQDDSLRMLYEQSFLTANWFTETRLQIPEYIHQTSLAVDKLLGEECFSGSAGALRRGRLRELYSERCDRFFGHIRGLLFFRDVGEEIKEQLEEEFTERGLSGGARREVCEITKQKSQSRGVSKHPCFVRVVFATLLSTTLLSTTLIFAYTVPSVLFSSGMDHLRSSYI